MFKGLHFCPKFVEVKEWENHKQLRQLLVQTVLPLQLWHKDAFNKGLFGKKDGEWAGGGNSAAKPIGTHSQKRKL